MMTFKIIESPDDLSVQAEHFYDKNIIILGASQKCDYKINDPNLNKNQALVLEIEGENLYVSSLHPQDIFWVNGKRTTHLKKVQANDILSYGKTKIKILSYSYKAPLNKQEIIAKNNEIIQNKPEYAKLQENLTFLQNELSKLL